MPTYSYGVPAWLINGIHLLIGAYFIYLGIMISKSRKLSTVNGIILIILGSLAAFYHLHIILFGSKL